jgi:hypothetical protein
MSVTTDTDTITFAIDSSRVTVITYEELLAYENEEK